MTLSTPKNEKILSRQIAFAAAFLLPAAKLSEVPSILAKYAAGDLLLSALLHFMLQAAVLFAILIASSRSEKPLLMRLQEKLGKGIVFFYILYAAYFIFAAVVPLLDLEKFTYAVFFDTSPTLFSFLFFFFLSAFICTKGIKSIGRAADLCLFLFVFPFLALIVMSLTETDFSRLLPLFGTKWGDTMSAFTHTIPYFSDAVLLLPLIGNLRYQKKDGLKIMSGYGVGAAGTLLFLAVFYGIYGSIAPREHYAFSKIAQYFPALSTIGRIDLIFVYALTAVLFFFTCLPLQYTVELTCHNLHTERRTLFSAILNGALMIFVLYANRHYNFFRTLFCGKLGFVFLLVADILPLFLLFLPKEKEVDHV